MYPICIILICLVALLARQERKIRRLEKTFGEILSGEMLSAIYEAMRECMKPSSSESFDKVSQETIDELNATFEAIEKRAIMLKEMAERKVISDSTEQLPKEDEK